MRLWSGPSMFAGLRLLCGFAAVVCGRAGHPERGARRLDLWDSSSLLQTSVNVSDHADRLRRGVKYVMTLANVEDLQYEGLIVVAGQKLQGVMDTGSFDLLTFKKDDCEGCGTAASLDCNDEKVCTFEEDTGGCIEYGSGKACAYKATTDVSLGPLKSQGQSMLLGYRAEMELLKESSFQAIVGIGLPSKSEELLPSLGVQYFSACLPSKASGQIVWNDDPPKSYFKSMQNAGQVYWGLAMSDAYFDGPAGKLSLGCSPSCGAIIDTGTSLVGVPSLIYQKARKGLEDMGGDCRNLSSLPTLRFKLGGNDFELPPEAFVGAFVRKTIAWLPDWVPQPMVMDCELLLIDLGNLNTQKGLMWILGMPFFRYYYTVFDLGEPGGISKTAMKIHTAPTGTSCSPKSAREAHPQRGELMTVDPRKVLTPKWLRDAWAVNGTRGSKNVTVPF